MRKNKKSRMMLTLVVILLCITIGYAYLNSNLSINGISNITRATWDIHFENIQIKSGSITPTTAATIDSNRDTISYVVTLEKPGDYYEFTVDAVNSGTIDGMVSNITSKLNNVVITSLPSYLDYSVSYEDGTEILNNHLLAAGSSVTYKVHVGYKSDIQASQLPESNQTLSFSLSVSFVQADNSAVAFNSSVTTIYTANVYDSSNVSNTTVTIGETIPSAITQYSTGPEALAALRTAFDDNNINFYLKHKVRNGIVLESYVDIIITQEMANSNNNLTAGAYSIRGGVDESISSLQPVYDGNKTQLLAAYGSSSCTESDSFFCRQSASGLSMNVGIFSMGRVDAFYHFWACGIMTNGKSYCYLD